MVVTAPRKTRGDWNGNALSLVSTAASGRWLGPFSSCWSHLWAICKDAHYSPLPECLGLINRSQKQGARDSVCAGTDRGGGKGQPGPLAGIWLVALASPAGHRPPCHTEASRGRPGWFVGVGSRAAGPRLAPSPRRSATGAQVGLEPLLFWVKRWWVLKTST